MHVSLQLILLVTLPHVQITVHNLLMREYNLIFLNIAICKISSMMEHVLGLNPFKTRILYLF